MSCRCNATMICSFSLSKKPTARQRGFFSFAWRMVRLVDGSFPPPSQRRDFPVCSSFPSHIEYILFTCRESPSIQTSVIPSHKSLSSFDPPPNAFHMNAENFFLKHSPHSVHIHVEFFIFTCQIALVIYHLKKCHSSCPSMLVGLLYVM